MRAYRRRAWAEAYARLSDADALEPLELQDLERVSLAAELMGRSEDATELLARAHQEALRVGDLPGAARAAFWLGFGLIHRGEFARGGGWVARAARLIEDGQLDCVERGYVLLPGAIRALDEGQPNEALAAFEQASRIAERFGDSDLATLGRLGRGNALIDLGETDRGVAFLDAAMVAVTADEVSPIVVGIVYCATIEACQRIFDLRRAQEWTAALARWCEAQPELQPFRGRCLLYQAELLQFHGAWQDAIAQTQMAFERLSRPPAEPAVAEAIYQQGELHRLRGEFAAADEFIGRRAKSGTTNERGQPVSTWQAKPALLRSGSRRIITVTQTVILIAHEPLEPYVEIALAAGDLDAAREAASGAHRDGRVVAGAVVACDGDPCRGGGRPRGWGGQSGHRRSAAGLVAVARSRGAV